MLIPKVVDNSASSNIQPPIFWYVVCIHETQLLARWTPKSELSVIGSFLWPKSATKMILITLLTKSTPPNEIICINDHSEVWIYDFCRRTPATSHSVIGLLAVKAFEKSIIIRLKPWLYVNIYHRIRLILTTGALVIFGTSNFPSDITNKSDGSKKSSDTPVWDSPAVLWGAQKMP